MCITTLRRRSASPRSRHGSDEPRADSRRRAGGAGLSRPASTRTSSSRVRDLRAIGAGLAAWRAARRSRRDHLREPARVGARDLATLTARRDHRPDLSDARRLAGPQYILADSGARVAIVSDAVQLAKIQQIRHELPALEAVIVVMELRPASSRARCVTLDCSWSAGNARLGASGGARVSGAHRGGAVPTTSPRSSTHRARPASPRA